MDRGALLKAIDKLVREGRAVHVMIDGKPGIKLVNQTEDQSMSKLETITIGTAAQVHGEVAKLVQTIMARHPDGKHNQGRSILEAFIWDEVQRLAKGKSDQVWDRMEKAGVYEKPESTKPGKFECGESPHFVIRASVSEPVKRFQEDELARVLEASQFKIPPHMTKGFVSAAKVPGNGQVRITIAER
jgi:hypothetical protein